MWAVPYRRPRLTWFRLDDGTEGVVLPRSVGDSVNLDRMSLNGRTSPLTRGTGLETSPVVTPTGQLLFVRAEQTPSVLSLDVASGDLTPRVEAAPGLLFDASRDGKTMVYKRTIGQDRAQVVLRDRASGTSTVIADHQLRFGADGSMWPQMSPDGTRVAYGVSLDGRYVVSVRGGAPERVADFSDFGLQSGWFPDGYRVIGECQPVTDGICELDLERNQVRRLLQDPRGGQLLYPSFSWDGQWVTFMRRRAGTTDICVTPVGSDGSLGGEATWVQISDDGRASRPRFSPDGSAIYYLRVTGGLLELVKQTLGPVDKRPRGDVERLATVQRTLDGSSVPTVVVTSDRVFFNTVERHSNIWMAQIQ